MGFNEIATPSSENGSSKFGQLKFGEGFDVERDGKKLVPTALGTTINDLLEAQFNDIVNVKFSAEMETNLDEIEEGKKEWTQVLGDFYTGFDKLLKKAEEETFIAGLVDYMQGKIKTGRGKEYFAPFEIEK